MTIRRLSIGGAHVFHSSDISPEKSLPKEGNNNVSPFVTTRSISAAVVLLLLAGCSRQSSVAGSSPDSSPAEPATSRAEMSLAETPAVRGADNALPEHPLRGSRLTAEKSGEQGAPQGNDLAAEKTEKEALLSKYAAVFPNTLREELRAVLDAFEDTTDLDRFIADLPRLEAESREALGEVRKTQSMFLVERKAIAAEASRAFDGQFKDDGFAEAWRDVRSFTSVDLDKLHRFENALDGAASVLKQGRVTDPCIDRESLVWANSQRSRLAALRADVQELSKALRTMPAFMSYDAWFESLRTLDIDDSHFTLTVSWG
jgi:hypothetical protein